MKKSILILGITLVSLTNVCNASNAINHKNNTFQGSVLTDYNLGSSLSEMATVVKPSLKEDLETFSPETVIRYDNRKTIVEIIREDDKITEYTNTDELEFVALQESMKEVIAESDLITEFKASDNDYTLYTERTIEDEIAELEMIIESKETNEASPLDFKKINSNSILMNGFNAKRFVGMK
ncbi:hypothetical protein [Flavobacterium laiguense]|nr:hypothetical protein [Flavobacterium laiguense]